MSTFSFAGSIGRPASGGVHSLSPSKETVCGLSLALSLTETEPKDCSSPHRTMMVQDFPDRGPALQLFVLEKCRRFLAHDLASAWDWCPSKLSIWKVVMQTQEIPML